MELVVEFETALNVVETARPPDGGRGRARAPRRAAEKVKLYEVRVSNTPGCGTRPARH